MLISEAGGVIKLEHGHLSTYWQYLQRLFRTGGLIIHNGSVRQFPPRAGAVILDRYA